jgi:hypothetical protein
MGRDTIELAYQSRDRIRTTTKRSIDLHLEDRKSSRRPTLPCHCHSSQAMVRRSNKIAIRCPTYGQANWYLQSRITQCADYSITLDQSRYAALVLHLMEHQTCTTNKMKSKYSTPAPTTTVFTKSDCSPTYSKVTELQQEYGFEYAAVIGSLIYLMNTYIRLNHTIRKLARFMQYPGRNPIA